MKEFVSFNIHDNINYGMNKYVSYDQMSNKYQAFISLLSFVSEPQIIKKLLLIQSEYKLCKKRLKLQKIIMLGKL